MKIRFDTAPIAHKHWFSSPVEVVRAFTPEHVAAAFAKLERAKNDGFWIAGYANYELGYALEPKLVPHLAPERTMPLMEFGIYTGPSKENDPQPHGYALGEFASSWSLADYTHAFSSVKDWIAAGDVYQINLTFQMLAQFTGDPWGAYCDLIAAQNVPHGAFVELSNGRTILSRSPELFFRTTADGLIETRPMKGTQPRHVDPTRDAQARDFLKNDMKNRAENLMIVDLLRNDISRICAPSSVKVPELFAIETYTTVHQMVSRISGRLKTFALAEIFQALFPCGSITGAPKIRAMEIIHALEAHPRDTYCGTIGWMAPDGRSEFNVAIRTILIENGQARLNVGGGVVYDSDPESEYEEAHWKARFAKLSPPVAA